MKKIPAVLLLVAFAACSSSHSKTDFSGIWKANPTKSTFADGGPGGPGGPGAPDSSKRPDDRRPAPAPRDQGGPGGPGGPGGRRGGFMAGQLTIKQAENELTIERSMKNREGEDITTSETYTLDGKESVNESRMGEKTTICKWSADGKTLTMESLQIFNREGRSMEMKSIEVYSLEGGNLVIESTMETPRGERKMKMVYDKQ